MRGERTGTPSPRESGERAGVRGERTGTPSPRGSGERAGVRGERTGTPSPRGSGERAGVRGERTGTPSPRESGERAGVRGMQSGIAFARSLRCRMTVAERALWRRLRNRKTAGAKFRRQHSFGGYVLDFYCAERKLGIELDGDLHAFPRGHIHDRARTDALGREGIRIVRFWNHQVKENLEWVLEQIRKELLMRPSPRSARWEGEGRGGEESSNSLAPRERGERAGVRGNRRIRPAFPVVSTPRGRYISAVERGHEKKRSRSSPGVFFGYM